MSIKLVHCKIIERVWLITTSFIIVQVSANAQGDVPSLGRLSEDPLTRHHIQESFLALRKQLDTSVLLNSIQKLLHDNT